MMKSLAYSCASSNISEATKLLLTHQKITKTMRVPLGLYPDSVPIEFDVLVEKTRERFTAIKDEDMVRFKFRITHDGIKTARQGADATVFEVDD